MKHVKSRLMDRDQRPRLGEDVVTRRVRRIVLLMMEGERFIPVHEFLPPWDGQSPLGVSDDIARTELMTAPD